MIALIDIDAAMRDATIIVALVVASLLFLSGCLMGSAITSWWHERRQPHRAWRYQIARDLHGDAKFEPDEPNIVSVASVARMEPVVRGAVATDDGIPVCNWWEEQS